MIHLVTRFLIKRSALLCMIITILLVFGVFNYAYMTKMDKVVNNATSQIKTNESAINRLRKAKATPPTSTPPVAPPTVASTPALEPISTCNNATSHTDPTQIDVLVNKKHCLVPLSFVPSDLVTIDGATLSAKAASSFDAMFKQASADGQAFGVSSSYRSYATQVSTYDHWVSVSGQTAADTYSARAGYSEHQTGLAVDLEAGGDALSDFVKTTQYSWLQSHAADYGFIQRYPDGDQSITGYETEEWHYRYVGTAVAQDMKAKGIATLEQYWGISGGDYN